MDLDEGVKLALVLGELNTEVGVFFAFRFEFVLGHCEVVIGRFEFGGESEDLVLGIVDFFAEVGDAFMG
jgi:hypothetical protein